MLKSAMAVGAVLAAVSVMVGCAGTRIKQLSGSEFLKQAEQTAQLNSFQWTSYIGTGNDRAYLEYGYPSLFGSGMRVTVFWTPFSQLPSNLVSELRSGKRPWTNSMDRIGQPTSPGDVATRAAPEK